MKNVINLFIVLLIAVSNLNCGDASQASGGDGSGFTISGNVFGANAMHVYFDKVGISPTSASLIQAKTEASPNGDYSITLPNKIEAGIYRLRIGAQKATLILDGTENAMTLNGELAKLNKYQYDVTGSESTIAYRDMMQRLNAQQASIGDVKGFVETTPNSLVALVVGIQALEGKRQYLDVYKGIKDRLAKQYPGSSYLNEYDQVLASMQKINAGRGFKFVEASQRQPAPDIKLPNPDGKEYALSDLKGQVVLLDFWASWCRPCRAENPNVVRVYNKYKDRGFTVFSVSLDGLDSRSEARYKGNSERLAEAKKTQKKRWEEAIAKDGLVWDYHVSDLKKWESAPARLYGVNSIPRTFLIDKDGKIAAMNLRGAEQIEEVLLQLL